VDEQRMPSRWEVGGRQGWRVRAPDGRRYLVAVAPRGRALYLPSDASLVGSLIEDAVAAGRYDGTWKVGVFRSEAMRVRRRQLIEVGITEEAALARAEALRGAIMRGDPPVKH
jgi:hypothetical protein